MNKTLKKVEEIEQRRRETQVKSWLKSKFIENLSKIKRAGFNY